MPMSNPEFRDARAADLADAIVEDWYCNPHVGRIDNTLRDELKKAIASALLSARRVPDGLAAESVAARKLIRGVVKKLPDGSIVELDANAFRAGWYLEWENACAMTDAANAARSRA